MKTPEEIKKGLECCAVDKIYCQMECPYVCECHLEDNPRAFVRDALAYIQQLEAAQPKWIDMLTNPPKEGEIGFVFEPREGWMHLVRVIGVTSHGLNVKAIWPEHGVPRVYRYWMPLHFPEPPEEEV